MQSSPRIMGGKTELEIVVGLSDNFKDPLASHDNDSK